MAYNILTPVTVLSDASMGTDLTSAVVEVKYQDNVGIQLHWTGSPVGDFSVEVSSDYKEDTNGNVENAGHWIALPLSPAITAAGSADDAYIDINQTSAQYIRVMYARTSGTGVLTAIIVGKAV